MSLIPYTDDSLILNDPHSRSLVIVNPTQGKLSVFKEVSTRQLQSGEVERGYFLNFDISNQLGRNNINNNNDPNESNRRHRSIATFRCPQCGTEITDGNKISLPGRRPSYQSGNSSVESDNSGDEIEINGNFGVNYNNALPHFTLSPKYFQLLQSNHRHYSLPSIHDKPNAEMNTNTNFNEAQDYKSFIPEDLFIPGYFHKFFTTLSLLGNGARGSVFKVVHKIGDTPLGIFALKKISIGNDMLWFNKCIREVKALSSLTHKSANLITYNHVWLEMDESYGVTTKDKGQGSLDNGDHTGAEKIPCLFILQQYCPGGNLEDCILIEVLKKFPEKVSPEQRKKWFRRMRKMKRSKNQIKLGLSSAQILHIIRDITRGLHELHDIGLIHRDLKPSNCLLLSKYKEKVEDTDEDELNDVGDDDEEIKIEPNNKGDINDEIFPTVIIGDLGESQILGEARSATGATGTIEYTAPEVIINSKPGNNLRPGLDIDLLPKYNEYTFASDMYSFGMIVHFIVFGKLPFILDSADIPEMKDTVKSFKIDKSAMIEEHKKMNLKPIDHRIFDIIESLLSVDPNYRPTAKNLEEYVDHLILNIDDSSSFNNNGNDNDLNQSIFSPVNSQEMKKNDGSNNNRFNIEEDEVSLANSEEPIVNSGENEDFEVDPLHSDDEDSLYTKKEYLALTDSHQQLAPPPQSIFIYYYQILIFSTYIYVIISTALTAIIYYQMKDQKYAYIFNLLSVFLVGLSINSTYYEARKITLFLFLLFIVSKVLRIL
ncbi:hypothetical protein MOUN0_K02718 [Monosporozyma unispora]